MSIVVIGVNHRTGPLALLERVAISAERAAEGGDRPHQPAEHPRGRRAQRRATAPRCTPSPSGSTAPTPTSATSSASSAACAPDELHAAPLQPARRGRRHATCSRSPPGSTRRCSARARSSVRCATRGSWPRHEGGAKATLNLLFRHALETGKRARTETAIGRGTASVSHAAVEMATERLGTLAGKRVLVVGAGEMGEGIAAALVARRRHRHRRHQPHRSSAPAQLAERVGGRVVPFGKLPTALWPTPTCCSPAPAPAASSSTSTRWSPGALEVGRPLLIVDIAVPRDVAPDVDRAARRHAARTSTTCATGPAGASPQRAGETDRVRAIVAEEVERFVVEATARQAAPLVAQLHEQAEPIRARRARALRQPPGRRSTTRQRAAVEAVTKGIVAKLLHQPSVKLKDDAGTPQGERNAAAVRDLFDLADSMPAPAAAPGHPGQRAGHAPRRSSVADALRRPIPGSTVELVFVETTGRPARRRAAAHDRRPGRVRQGGAARRARRATPTSPCTPPRTCRRHRPTGLTIAAFCEPARVRRDALVGLDARRRCRAGATVATGSVRRRAQLAVVRPDLALRRAARQHPDPARQGARRRRDRDGRRRARDPRPHRPDRRGARSAERSCPPSARAASPSSAGPTTPRRPTLLAAIDHAASSARRSRSSGRSSPSSARAARCRSARTRPATCSPAFSPTRRRAVPCAAGSTSAPTASPPPVGSPGIWRVSSPPTPAPDRRSWARPLGESSVTVSSGRATGPAGPWRIVSDVSIGAAGARIPGPCRGLTGRSPVEARQDVGW